MCDHHIIESVRRSMMSRRGLLALGAGGALAAGLSPATTRAQATSAPAASPGAGATLRDLTHTLSEDFPTFSGKPGFSMEQQYEIGRDGYNLFILRTEEHTGTHLDAPLHFSADGISVDELPVESLMAPLVIVDITAKAESDPDAQLTPEDLDAWIAANGELPARACVAMHSGWARHVDTPMFRNAGDGGTMHFPGFHPDTIARLLETDAVAIAVDTLSLDYGASTDFAVHLAWLSAGRYGIECVAGLADLPATGASIIVGAPKHKGGTGGPGRVFALA